MKNVLEKIKVSFCIVIFIFIFSAKGENFNDGNIYNIGNVVSDTSYVSDDMVDAVPTVVNINDGGSIDAVYLMDKSFLNVVGGEVGTITTYGKANVSVRLGYVHNSIVLNDNSTCVIEDGIFDAISVEVRDRASLSIYDGLFTFGEAGLVVKNDACVKIFGYNFTVDNQPVTGNTAIEGSGILRGISLEGNSFAFPFTVEYPAKLIVNAQYEPNCTGYPKMDFNNDCKVDLLDFSEFMGQWLECNLNPQSYCF